MALQQVNLRIEEPLLERFKAEAKARGISANMAAALAFESWLAGGQADTSFGKQPELADVLRRLEVLERKLAKAPPSTPSPAAPPPPAEPAEIPQLGDGAICTADLATATGTNRAAWNNWARDKNPGAIRKMGPDVGNWRYLGKVPSELGGPDRGMWERA
jgi:type IV secretory pathway VirB10-like protein